ncbi:methyl-accepting chemotaxis protein [Sporosarcina sp. ACRSL]|uniref:methyl-accepting chemotaxis protein n=1 Tax=Sporosarcina sp. ACRSL TaxID=2918215 RepID=UPI001EF5B728|nr:methyl-accepting chemotaxis protein [Sporosarcina sp. ACRSL]MCG7345529.1 methyl-accepting chemotaxis protein [Sporosarcina sp. ACRSL]
MKWIRDMKIATKISMIVIAILLVFSTTIMVTINLFVTDVIKEIAIKTVTKDLELGYHTLDKKYPGDWEIKEGLLYKGDTLVNNNYAIVDEIASITKGTSTIFQGDTRVTTNVKLPNGERAVNTQASAAVVKSVLQDGRNFYGEADVAGQLTQTAYQPIKANDGTIIGMWYLGESTAFIDETIASIRNLLLAVLAIGIIVSVLIVILFTNRIKNQLSDIGATLEKAGAGDFTGSVHVRGRDEIGLLASNFNSMRKNLRELIFDVTEVSKNLGSHSDELARSAIEVGQGTEQVSATMQELASGAETQAHHTSELSSAMNTFITKIDGANSEGQAIQRSTKSVIDMTSEGSLLIESSTKQMGIIADIVSEAVQKVDGLDRQSQRISELVVVIKGIAEQTNLLALNAAIEAARAGEQGKGFAVVADEVRKLAEQSSVSVTTITEIVQGIQNESRAVAMSLRDSYTEVQEGTSKIQATDKTFEKISNAVEGMVKNITEVSMTLSEIAENSYRMGDSIQDIAAISQQSAAGIEETSASTEQTSASMENVSSSSIELAKLAERLNHLVQQFKL